VKTKPEEQDEKKKLWLEFAGPRINLLAGEAAVSALQSMTYRGIAHSALAVSIKAKEFAAIENPTDSQKRDFKLNELLHQCLAEPAKTAVDAAAIIYAHAILDATIYQLCSISISIDSNSWASFIKEKKVSFSDIRQNNDVNAVQKKLLESYLAQLERESLLVKCDVLFKLIKPLHTRRILSGFKYSRERLVALDSLRHDLVHKLKFHRSVRQSKAKTDYLFQTGKFFVNLLSKHYKVEKASFGRK
jgi:hypothetical protein